MTLAHLAGKDRPIMYAADVFGELFGCDGAGFWTDDSAPRLLALFRARAWKHLGPDREEVSRLFMGLVAIQFASHGDWRDGLTRVHLRADDVAQVCVIHLLRKAPRIWEAIGPKLRGRRRGHYKLLLAACNSTIVRKVLEQIAGVRRRRVHGDSLATDVFNDGASNGSPSGAFAGIAAPPEERFEVTGAMTELLHHLRSAEDDVIGDIVVCGKRAVDAVSALNERLCNAVAAREGILTHEELPVRLRHAVPSNLHALLSSRLIRLAQRYAEAAA